MFSRHSNLKNSAIIAVRRFGFFQDEIELQIHFFSSIHKQTKCQFECHVNANELSVVDFCNVEEMNINLNGMYWRLMPLGKFIYF